MRNNPIALIDPTGMSDQSVGADGLTNDQWIQSSKPNALAGTAAMFRSVNRSNEIADQRKKQGVASAMSLFWTAVDNGATPEYTSNGLVLDYNTLGNEFVFNTNGYGQTGRDTKNHRNFISYSDFDVKADNSQNQDGGYMDRTLAVFGTGAYSLENFSGLARFGTNLRFYGVTANNGVFWGNQFVKTFSIAKVGKLAGVGGAVLGETIDLVKYSNGEISGGKLSSDTVFGAAGFTPAAPISVMYFGFDAFYPGGWPGFIKYAAPIMDQAQKNMPQGQTIFAL